MNFDAVLEELFCVVSANFSRQINDFDLQSPEIVGLNPRESAVIGFMVVVEGSSPVN